MSRLRYVLKRALLTVPVVWLGTSFTWAAVFLGPIDPAAAIVGQQPSNSGQYQSIRDKLGLTQPPLQQYLEFMSDMLVFDLGQTWIVYAGSDVNALIMDFLPQTLWLGFWSVVIAVFVGVPLGFYAGTHSNTLADYLTSFAGISWRAMPNFWLAAVILSLLINFESTVGTAWEPLGVEIAAITGNPGLGHIGENPLNVVRKPMETLRAIKKVAPAAIVLGSASMGNEIRIGRTAVMEVKNRQFVDFARARGVSERRLVWKHILRNALIPLVPIITTEAFLLIGGSVLVENVFGISGMGSLFLRAAIEGDIPVLGTLMFVFILLLVGINLLQDVLYTLIDPRIGLEGETT